MVHSPLPTHHRCSRHACGWLGDSALSLLQSEAAAWADERATLESKAATVETECTTLRQQLAVAREQLDVVARSRSQTEAQANAAEAQASPRMSSHALTAAGVGLDSLTVSGGPWYARTHARTQGYQRARAAVMLVSLTVWCIPCGWHVCACARVSQARVAVTQRGAGRLPSPLCRHVRSPCSPVHAECT